MIDWRVWILLGALLVRVIRSQDQHYVIESENIALNKPTRQSSTVIYNSSLVVNGNYDDFSETNIIDFNWWTVDLVRPAMIVSIKVHNRRDCCQHRMSKISIWTSNVGKPGDPTSNNEHWIEQFHREKSAQWFIIKAFREAIEARHVAITTQSTNEPLNLAEVEIYDTIETANLAREKPVLYNGDSPSDLTIANNGMVDDCLKIDVSQKWWQVDLGTLYSLSYIKVYKGVGCAASDLIPIQVSSGKNDSQNPSSHLWQLFPNRLKGNSEYWELKQIVRINAHGEVARYVKVESAKPEPLALSEVEVYAENSVAFKRPTNQSSLLNHYDSHLAVNGYFDDFTHTRSDGEKFWQVNLLYVFRIEAIAVVNRVEIWERIAHLSVLTAKFDGIWTLRKYMAEAFHTRELFVLQTEMQFIRLRSNHSDSPLSLAEVIVIEQRIDEYESISQSSTMNDGSTNSSLGTNIAVTDFYTDVEQWWKVKLTKLMIMKSVNLSFDDGQCQRTLQEPLVPCTTLSGKIQIKTSIEDEPPTVTLADHPQWSLCYSQDEEPFCQLHIICNRNKRHRYIRHLSVQHKSVGQQINLKSLDIYGQNLPEVSNSVDARVKLLNSTSLQIFFPVWSPSDTGAFPPTMYEVKLAGVAETQTLRYNQNADYLLSTWSNLTPGMSYNYSITCKFREVNCAGKVLTGVTNPLESPTDPTKQFSTRKSGTQQKEFQGISSDPSIATKKSRASSSATTVQWCGVLYASGVALSFTRILLDQLFVTYC